MPEAINIQHVFTKHIGHVNKVFQFEIRIRKFLEIPYIVVINGNSGRKVEIARAVAWTAEKEQYSALIVKYLYIFKRGIYCI